jgi:hypothetical protein
MFFSWCFSIFCFVCLCFLCLSFFFWLLYGGKLLVVLLLLGIRHYAIAFGCSSLCYCFWVCSLLWCCFWALFIVFLTPICTRWNCYLTFQNKLVFFSNSINIFFPFLSCFLCVCVVFLQDQSLSISCKFFL